MTDGNGPLAPFYEAGWSNYNDYLVKAIGNLSQDQLQLTVAASQRQVWSLAVHILGTRVHWLTRVAGEEDPASNPLLDWDEDGEPIFTPAQIVDGLQKSWNLVASVLNRWTVDTMNQTHASPDGYEDARGWIIWHLIEHDVHHGGELFYTLGSYGIEVPKW
jgi:uncharacterized damage-inducible protein DinB